MRKFSFTMLTLAVMAACDPGPGGGGDTDTSTETGAPVVSNDADAQDLCAEQADGDACVAVDFGPDSGYRCVWAEPVVAADPCGPTEPSEPRCLAAAYHGEGCGFYCASESLLSWRTTDAGFEYFADSICEYSTIGWDDWSPAEDWTEAQIACACAVTE